MQEATDGRFRLGLGTQVRTHVVRRYGAEFERPGPRLRDYVLAVKACFTAFRTGKLDHRGDFYSLDFITPQWSPGPIDAPDPKVDIAAVNPWMLRMAGEVADGIHVHPLGEPGYIARHVMPNRAEGAAKSGRSPEELAVIVPVMTIVGDTDEERDRERELVRASMSFYGSTPNYAFIWDEAGFEGTTARIREKQKAGDYAGMAAQITDEHIATFATESTWDGLADALSEKYAALATRIVLYNAAAESGPAGAVRSSGSAHFVNVKCRRSAQRPGGPPDTGTHAAPPTLSTAGQTSPGGITIRGFVTDETPFQDQAVQAPADFAENWVLQHIRIRAGLNGPSDDGLRLVTPATPSSTTCRSGTPPTRRRRSPTPTTSPSGQSLSDLLESQRGQQLLQRLPIGGYAG